MTPNELRDVLRSGNDLRKRAFEIGKALCSFAAAERDEAQELLLRALDRRAELESIGPIIDGLTREFGLFPYLEAESLGLADLFAYEYHKPYGLEERQIVFHRPQAHVYRELMAGRNVVLSAPTSFGKSLVIDAVVASRRFNNILVLVPTIALIDETRRRLSAFSDFYKIVTHPFQELSTWNIFVLTQERALDLPTLDEIDFFVVDEFYKLSPTREADEGRWNLLNQVVYRLIKKGKQFYMLGPGIDGVSRQLTGRFECTVLIENYQTVVSEEHRLEGVNVEGRLVELCKSLTGPTIVFCQSPGRAAEIAQLLSANLELKPAAELSDAVDWIASNYHPDWHFCKALAHGIGVHHGRIPRSLGQFVVRAFNREQLRILVCTSTLIEGVNTKAENIIIVDNKINRQNLDFFTFNNIRGRSGRMFQHFVGHVYLLHDPPPEGLPFVDVPAFDQDERTPESLLLQLDKEDLTPRSTERLERFSNQEVLSIGTLRANSGVDPDSQLNLAQALLGEPEAFESQLAWDWIPNRAQLLSICNIMWTFFDGRRLGAGSALSVAQLAAKIRQLTFRPATRELIERTLPYAGDNPDRAVQSVLDFSRLWATFHFPRLLRVIDRIQREIMGRLGKRTGNYEYFASALESLFMDRAVFALDEYGIPLELARRLEDALEPKGDLDVALRKLQSLKIETLHPFEQALVAETIKGVPA